MNSMLFTKTNQIEESESFFPEEKTRDDRSFSPILIRR